MIDAPMIGQTSRAPADNIIQVREPLAQLAPRRLRSDVQHGIINRQGEENARFYTRLNATTAFVPPMAKALLSATCTFRSRGTLGVKSRSQAGSGSR